MHTAKRNGNKWTTNEIMKLQREYELLEWNIQQIAVSHHRTVKAILYKLESEGFITNWHDARGFDVSLLTESEATLSPLSPLSQSATSSSTTWRDVHPMDDEDEEDEYCDDAQDEDYVDSGGEDDEDDEDERDEYDDEVAQLSKRVWSLETSLSDIGNMVKQLFDSLAQKKKATPKKLRAHTIH
jgi:hypothetical protein